MPTVLPPTKTLDAREADLATEPIRKQFTAAVGSNGVDDAQRTVKFVITNGSVDRDNDTISPNGWDFADYMRSPVVLWAHDYAQPPVARALDITIDGANITSTAQFPPKGVYPFADMIFELTKFGALNTCSVGFKPLEYARDEQRGGLNFMRQSLLEWSIVPVPANPQALIVARAAGIDVQPLLDWATDITKALGKQSSQTDDGALTSPAHVPAPGTATTVNLCPACGASYDGDICAGCGWRAPASDPGGADEHPMTVPVQQSPTEALFVKAGITPKGLYQIGQTFKTIKLLKRTQQPSSNLGGVAVALGDDDPIRWNRSLSKAFDVAGEPLEPHRLEVAWVSRYIGVPVQELNVTGFTVPSARMGSFLAAFDERIAAFDVEALRSMTESGRETPPLYESIQLNSTTTRSYMIAGTRFMRRKSDGLKIVAKFSPTWCGLDVNFTSRHDAAAQCLRFIDEVSDRATQLNYLRGEAFTLSGEFLDRGNLNWDALFLEPQKEATLRRTIERLNDAGEDMDSRGLMLMGPPGTGKTLSGRVMMRQAQDATFIWISARDFYRMGAFGAFTYAYDLAHECASPDGTILFFEDVDNWLGRDTIDLLKTEMDGLKRRKGIQTILTTNFPELLPEALIDRPGRFHDLLELALPTEAVRTRMLGAWLPETTLAQRQAIARDTDGFSGAHMRELVNFAQVIGAEQQLGISDALTAAIAKLQEQRELVASLHEPSDYRPRHVVRAAVRQSLEAVTKRGRVLSARNEGKIRAAKDHLDGVLEQLQQQEVVDLDDDVSSTAAASVIDGEVVLTIADDTVECGIDLDDAKQAIVMALKSALPSMVREQTQTALRKARGRVD